MSTAAEPRRAADTQWLERPPDVPSLGLEDAVRTGLTSPGNKSLPSQFFYDAEGSRLFEAICDLPEYYLTRAEAQILEQHADALAERLPEVHAIVELGSGSGVKTDHLIRAFGQRDEPLCYAPVDVSRSALEGCVERFETSYPDLALRPVVAEYETGLAAVGELDLGPTLTVWLGSSIGNLTKPAAAEFLSSVRETVEPSDRLLVGIDLRKDRETLEAAYDDAQGVTAEFDLNLLARINRELEGGFDLDRFRHRVHYDEASGAVQSFLESVCDQSVEIGALDLEVDFTAGERIHTEDSHKYGEDEIDALADRAGFATEERLFDAQRRFTLNLFRPS